MGSTWIGSEGGIAAYLILWSNVKNLALGVFFFSFFFFYIITCQSFGRLFWYLISRDNLLISTSDCKFLFFFTIFCESLQNACCARSIKLISNVYLCLLQWAHVDHGYLLHFPQVPVNPTLLLFCSWFPFSHSPIQTNDKTYFKFTSRSFHFEQFGS